MHSTIPIAWYVNPLPDTNRIDRFISDAIPRAKMRSPPDTWDSRLIEDKNSFLAPASRASYCHWM